MAKSEQADQPTDVFTEDMTPEKTIEEQARDQIGQKKIRVRIDESNVKTNYVSGFRPSMAAEEFMLDLGLNSIRPTGGKDQPYELVFQVNNRVIMNYYSAKRLALILSQVVRKYEEKFGEIELNAAKRQASKPE
jgi:hypothetical protein